MQPDPASDIARRLRPAIVLAAGRLDDPLLAPFSNGKDIIMISIRLAHGVTAPS